MLSDGRQLITDSLEFWKMNGKQTKDTFNEQHMLFFCGKKKKMKSRKFADSLSSELDTGDFGQT